MLSENRQALENKFLDMLYALFPIEVMEEYSDTLTKFIMAFNTHFQN
jgi:hypothetical protein